MVLLPVVRLDGFFLSSVSIVSLLNLLYRLLQLPVAIKFSKFYFSLQVKKYFFSKN